MTPRIATTFLIAHVNSAGTGVAQVEITAEPTTDLSAEANAKRQFAILYPEREISVIGVKEGQR